MLKKLSPAVKIIVGVTVVVALSAIVVLTIILTKSPLSKTTLQSDDSLTTDVILVEEENASEQVATSDIIEATESDNISDNEVEEGGEDRQNQTPIAKDNPTGAEFTDAEMDAFWLHNSGYWFSTLTPNPYDDAVPSDDKFVGFFKEDGVYRFEYGLYRSSFWIGGEVISAKDMGDYRTELSLHIAATPETAVDIARPERIEIIYIHEIDNSTNIRIEQLGEGAWFTYEYHGQTLEES
ncbi:MAG: hypothetical protein FWG21_06545 [Oscillospiraceae bacterium]|nr:hypothetical protein [Oscillospiraceae bacterium]